MVHERTFYVIVCRFAPPTTLFDTKPDRWRAACARLEGIEGGGGAGGVGGTEGGYRRG